MNGGNKKNKINKIIIRSLIIEDLAKINKELQDCYEKANIILSKEVNSKENENNLGKIEAYGHAIYLIGTLIKIIGG